MRLKARLRRLQADVDWLKTWGALRAIELQLKLLETQEAMSKAEEARRQGAFERAGCRRPNPPSICKIRPVRWRQRGPQDWDDDREDMVDRCLTEYDPLEGGP
jgi:hypothetical protein